MLKAIRRFASERSGATAIEYGLIAALVAVAAIGSLNAFGGELSDMFNFVSGSIDGVVPETTTTE